MSKLRIKKPEKSSLSVPQLGSLFSAWCCHTGTRRHAGHWTASHHCRQLWTQPAGSTWAAHQVASYYLNQRYSVLGWITSLSIPKGLSGVGLGVAIFGAGGRLSSKTWNFFPVLLLRLSRIPNSHLLPKQATQRGWCWIPRILLLGYTVDQMAWWYRKAMMKCEALWKIIFTCDLLAEKLHRRYRRYCRCSQKFKMWNQVQPSPGPSFEEPSVHVYDGPDCSSHCSAMWNLVCFRKVQWFYSCLKI